eukprot:g16621.t1
MCTRVAPGSENNTHEAFDKFAQIMFQFGGIKFYTRWVTFYKIFRLKRHFSAKKVEVSLPNIGPGRAKG